MKNPIVIVVVLLIVAGGGFFLLKGGGNLVSDPKASGLFNVEPYNKRSSIPLPDYGAIEIRNVIVRDTVPGEGARVEPNSTVNITFNEFIYAPARKGNRGRLVRKVEEPVRLRLDKDSILQGLKEGLYGMRAGGERLLVIPSVKAYGESGMKDKVPPGAIVQMEVKLHQVN